ncbi:MAG TPA: hypothetical protein VGE13_02160 [Candidatus Saccharimonadales bacterium]
MVKPRFEDFRYIAKSLDGVSIHDADVQRTAESRERVDVASDDGQMLGVFTTIPGALRYPEIIVRATAFSDDNGRPEGALFDSYLAEITHRRVMAVNMPGVDYFAEDKSTKHLGDLTPEQYESLRVYGSFRKVGAASMRALQNAAITYHDYDPQFILSASSMGVAAAAGMAREAFDKGIGVAGIALAEPVNHVQRPLGKLGLQFARTNSTAAGYLEMNPEPVADIGESMGLWVKRVIEARRANWVYARALSAGTFHTDLGSIEGLADTKTPLYISHGTASRLSSDKSGQDMREFLNSFAAMNTVQHDVLVGHDHPYTMTVQSVVDGVANITRR